MKSIITLMVLQIFVIAFAFSGMAQNKKTVITGRITSFEESLPLEGVAVTVKDTKNATGTQSDGTFSLEVSADDKFLIITLDEYERKEVKLSGVRQYDIVLKRSGGLALKTSAGKYSWQLSSLLQEN